MVNKGMRILTKTNGMVFIPKRDEDLTQCLICGAKRDWESEHIIFANAFSPVKITLCKECRNNHTMTEIADRVLKEWVSLMSEIISKKDK